MQISRILIIAPHLEYPTRNGADIYVDRIGCHLSNHIPEIKILGSNSLVTYQNGILIEEINYSNTPRSKLLSAFRTIFLNSHYLKEKFLTRDFVAQSRSLYSTHPDSMIIYSFLYSSALDLSNNENLVLTHNNEALYYHNLRQNSKNIFFKWVAANTENWFVESYSLLPSKYIPVHITRKDQIGLGAIKTLENDVVLQAGVEIPPIKNIPEWDGVFKLMFCGSLSVRMNLDALIFFSKQFYPILKKNLGEHFKIWVAGSNPSREIVNLCSQNQWSLFSNVSDKQLNELYRQATFSVLPFSYTTGAKIKLMNSLAAGLPVLATTNMLYYPNQNFFPNRYSDNPEDWLEHLKNIEEIGLYQSQRDTCVDFAKQYSWSAIMEKFVREMRKNKIIT